jgi:chemotaxis protein CheZ
MIGELDGAATSARLLELQALLAAGDETGFERSLHEWLGGRDRRLAHGVMRIVTRLHAAIGALDLDSRLQRLAGSEIPDACSRLDYVVQMSEAAAHRTLDLVEHGRGLIEDLSRQAASLNEQTGERLPEWFDASLGRCLSALRADLSALSQAQEYQDLSGQIIRKVTALVRDVERALLELLSAAGCELKFCEPAPMSQSAAPLAGPAVPGVNAASSQEDADALLANLGV